MEQVKRQQFPASGAFQWHNFGRRPQYKFLFRSRQVVLLNARQRRATGARRPMA